MTRKKTARPETFNLGKFYKQLDIAKHEQETVAECLARGLEHYHQHIYGYDKYGKRPDFLIGERMVEPYIFGFGAVEVVRHDGLSPETRYKIVKHAVKQIDATAEFGTPHGLPVMISFLAGAGALDLPSFRSLMIAADFGGPLFDDWELAEVRRLFGWLITKAGAADDEMLWWLWHICVHCESAQVCRALAEGLLAEETLSNASKRALCEAWLTDAPAGKPPAQWEAMNALLSGDVEKFVAYAAEAGLPVPDSLPSREAIEADYDSALDALMDESGDAMTGPPMSLQLLRNILVGPSGMVPLTPATLKRAAILALPALGDKPLKVCRQYLGSSHQYYADTVNGGVADVIRAYHDQMPEESVKALIEHGLKIGAVATRKTFYQLGADLFGQRFMARAAKDNAKSIREWAAKKAGGGPPRSRGRRKKTTAGR